jgi:hypothetical protein
MVAGHLLTDRRRRTSPITRVRMAQREGEDLEEAIFNMGSVVVSTVETHLKDTGVEELANRTTMPKAETRVMRNLHLQSHSLHRHHLHPNNIPLGLPSHRVRSD